MYVPSLSIVFSGIYIYANLASYDSFKIFMGLPTTGGGGQEKQGK